MNPMAPLQAAVEQMLIIRSVVGLITLVLIGVGIWWALQAYNRWEGREERKVRAIEPRRDPPARTDWSGDPILHTGTDPAWTTPTTPAPLRDQPRPTPPEGFVWVLVRKEDLPKS